MNQLNQSEFNITKINKLKKIIEGKNREIVKLKTKLEKNKIKHKNHLQEICDYYENIIALLPGHVYWMDKNNIFLACNDLQSKSAGLNSRKEIIGKTNQDMIWKDQAEALNKNNLKVMEIGEPYTTEEYAVMANGSGVYLSQKVPLYNKEKEIIGILGISFDITDRKKMQAELKSAKEESEMSKRNLISFIACLACNINCNFNSVFNMLNKLTPNKYFLKGFDCSTYLTKRELICLIYTVKGKTAKEIGSNLNISPKTAESYIMCIKEKLGCYNKSQLIEVFFMNAMQYSVNIKASLYCIEPLIKKEL